MRYRFTVYTYDFYTRNEIDRCTIKRKRENDDKVEEEK